MAEGPYPNHLAALMRAKGLTDPSLARAMGISKQQIFNLRWGHRKLTVEWAKRLAPHLGVTWQELITGLQTASEDQDRAELLAAYDAMNEDQRHALLMILKAIGPRQQTEEANSDPSIKPRDVA